MGSRFNHDKSERHIDLSLDHISAIFAIYNFP